MGQRHKHADVIIAWAEGKDVQVWNLVNSRWEAVEKRVPDFLQGNEYRIKPPAKKCRVALFRFSNEEAPTYTASTDTQEGADRYEQHKSFVRWLTDWIEYEE